MIEIIRDDRVIGYGDLVVCNNAMLTVAGRRCGCATSMRSSCWSCSAASWTPCSRAPRKRRSPDDLTSPYSLTEMTYPNRYRTRRSRSWSPARSCFWPARPPSSRRTAPLPSSSRSRAARSSRTSRWLGPPSYLPFVSLWNYFKLFLSVIFTYFLYSLSLGIPFSL